jgi:hypothetical protein
MNKRSEAIRIQDGVERGELVEFFVDGMPFTGYKGETIACALMNAGYFVSRTIDGNPLGVYCNIGVCYSCVMTVNGISSVRICKTPVSQGCRIESQHFNKGPGNERAI